MASFNIFFTRTAEKELRKIPSTHLRAIMDKVRDLGIHPRPPGVQMLKGEERYYRLRHSDYRIIYEVDDTGMKITIIKIGHRREVYD